MRDFSKALAGVEVQNMNLDNFGLSNRTRRRIYKFLDEIVVRDYSSSYSALSMEEGGIEAHTKEVDNLIEWRERSRRDIDLVLRVFMPNVDQDLPNALIIFPTIDAREKGRPARAVMKIGRALRRMFPVLLDNEVDNLVDVVKRKLIAQEYNYFVSKDASAFKKAYSWVPADYGNLDTTWSKKHMANSCMRYEFENLCAHPAEFYASGDFEIHWLETREGKIAARCVVAVAKAGANITPQPAPVYAVCEDSHEFLWNKLKAHGCLPISESDWKGCLLKVIYCNGSSYHDGFIGAYLDLDPRGAIYQEDSEYLVISPRGDVDCSNYGGVLFAGDRYTCRDCDEGLGEDEVYRGGCSDDYSYCSDCYWERYANCENCGDDEPRANCSDVMARSGYAETWCDTCCGNHAVEATDGNLWSETDVTLVASGDYVTEDELQDNYFLCSLVTDWYPNDQLCELSNGEAAALESIQDHNRFFDTKYIFEAVKGVWITPDEQETNNDVNLEESEAESA